MMFKKTLAAAFCCVLMCGCAAMWREEPWFPWWKAKKAPKGIKEPKKEAKRLEAVMPELKKAVEKVAEAPSKLLAGKPEKAEKETEPEGKLIDVIDFKDTPITDVLKIFTELTGENVVGSDKVKDIKVTIFLRDVYPKVALKTMCKLYNLWYQEDENVIRVITVEEYAKELTVTRDERTEIFNLKYASALGVADMLENLFGERIVYEEPEEMASYGHVGTEEEGGGLGWGVGGGRRGGWYGRSDRARRAGRRGRYGGRGAGYRARTTRYDATWAGTRAAQQQLLLERDIASAKIEGLEARLAAEGRKGVDMAEILKQRAEQAVIYMSVFPRNNCIAVRCVDQAVIDRIRDIIKDVDTPTSQILLEVKILEVTLSDDFRSLLDVGWQDARTSLNIGNFGAIDGATLIYQLVSNKVLSRLELFQQDNRVHVIGTPMIICANNAPGEFFVGEERPITINYEFEIREFEAGQTRDTTRPVIELRDIGTKTLVTPCINEDRTVTMRLLTEVNSVEEGGAFVSFINSKGETIQLPIDTVDTSTAESIIVAKDGHALAVGGLVRDVIVDYERKVPFLGDIPFIRWAFMRKQKRKEKREIVFIIIPHIMMKPEEGRIKSTSVLNGLVEHPYVRQDRKRLLQFDEDWKKVTEDYDKKEPHPMRRGGEFEVRVKDGYIEKPQYQSRSKEPRLVAPEKGEVPVLKEGSGPVIQRLRPKSKTRSKTRQGTIIRRLEAKPKPESKKDAKEGP